MLPNAALPKASSGALSAPAFSAWHASSVKTGRTQTPMGLPPAYVHLVELTLAPVAQNRMPTEKLNSRGV